MAMEQWSCGLHSDDYIVLQRPLASKSVLMLFCSHSFIYQHPANENKLGALRMLLLKGQLVDGIGDFRKRMTKYPDVFTAATGQRLFPGTLNVRVEASIPPIEHFRIRGSEIGEPEQDLLFEICRINDIWAYRIRPWHLLTHSGGHGDDILEIAANVELRPILAGTDIIVGMFR